MVDAEPVLKVVAVGRLAGGRLHSIPGHEHAGGEVVGDQFAFGGCDAEPGVIARALVQQAADAVYRIGWHNNLNQENDSWLRRHLVDARHEENDHFIQLMQSTTMGTLIHRRWQEFGRSCLCRDPEKGDGPECQVHETIRACQDYMTLIDEDWIRIADWYRPGARPHRGVAAEELYKTHIEAVRAIAQT